MLFWKSTRAGAIRRCLCCGVGINIGNRDNEDERKRNLYRVPQNSLASARLNDRYTKELLDRLANINSDVRRVLQIGSDAANFGRSIEKKGISCEIIEASKKTLCDLPKEISGLRVESPGDEGVLSENRYDLVLMFNVLQHSGNPVECLYRVKHSIVPGGSIVIVTPNLLGLEASLPGWTHYDRSQRYYFHDLSLSLTLNKTGFEILEIWTKEGIIGWPNTLIHSILPEEMLSHPSKNLSTNTVLAWDILRLAVGTIFWPLQKLQEKYNCGEQLWAIAKRPG